MVQDGVRRVLFTIFLLATIGATPVEDLGTSIIYIQSPMAIWVGVDSLIANPALDGGKNTFACKIYHQGPTYFTFAGILKISGHYDAVDVASKSVLLRQNVKGARDEFVAGMIPPFEKSLPLIEKAYPNFYWSNVEQPKEPRFAFFEAVFFAFEGGKPTGAYAKFRATRRQDRSLRIVADKDSCPGENCFDGTFVKPLGKSKAFQPPFTFDAFVTHHPVEDIIRLISLEEKAEPDYVGGNINVIRIDALGVHWETNNPECVGK